jgi:hypothetical protein
MAESEAVKSKRDQMLERMKGKYPGKEFADDEALYGQINDDYDSYDKELSGYKERENAFSDLFTKDKRSAAFLTAWRNGGDPVVELVRNFGQDIVQSLQDPDKQDALADAQKEYLDRVSKSDKLNKEFDQNFPESLALMDKIQEEDGVPPETMDKAFEFLMQLSHDALVGKFSEETIRAALKSVNYDTDVEDAGAAGEVRGRNQKIQEKLRKSHASDGTATLDGKNADGTQQRRQPDFNSGGSIWERGGMSRTKRNN